MNTIISILSFPEVPKLWSISRNLFILFSFLFLLACSNDDDSGCVGVDWLPPATTTGEGTFGCLVNGEPYVDLSGNFNCYYQLVDGEYYFNIGSDNEQAGLNQIIIGSTAKEISNNIPIELNYNSFNEFYAEIGLVSTQGDFTTTDIQDGIVTFTEFNTNSNIVSAIFEFNITIPETGEIIEITEGRFDSFFTQ
jgi:hypothetical protein